MPSRTLRVRIALIGLAALTLIWATAGYELERSRASTLREAQVRTAAQAHEFADYADATIKRLNELTLDLRSYWNGDWQSFAAVVRHRQENIQDIAFQVSVIDRDGILAFSNLARPGSHVDLSMREHFRVHQAAPGQDRLYISEPLMGKVSGKWSIQFTRPILRDGRFDGVLVISVSPELFSGFADKLGSEGARALAVVRDDGKLLARYPADAAAYHAVLSGRPYLGPGASESGTYESVSAISHQPMLSGYSRIPRYGLTFVVGEPLSRVFEHYHAYRTRVLAAGAMLSVLVAFLFLGLLRSLTSLERARIELTAAKERAEAASQAKSRFLATMSHEVRTPMNGVVGMTDLLLESELTPQQREHLGVVRNSANALLAIIDEILDFSQIEAGKMRVDHVAFDLHALLDDLARGLAPALRDKQLGWRCEIAPGLPRWVSGDPGRLRQVLLNLLSNAVKFTEQGRVELRVASCGELPDGVEFLVADTGVGIDPAQHQAIFEAFRQADDSTTRRFGGTGLGLAVCSRLVSLMGGGITLDSVPGHGSTFTVRLPLPQAEAPPSAAPAASSPVAQDRPARTLRVLVVDSSALNRKVLQSVLEGLGHRAVLAEDLPQALDAIGAQDFDLVLMDALTRADAASGAVEALRRADAARGRSRALPVHALRSSSAPAGQLLEQGFDGELAVPIQRAELLRLLQDAAARA